MDPMRETVSINNICTAIRQLVRAELESRIQGFRK
jgi:hypothetical protein